MARLTYVADLAPAHWIGDRLHRFAQDAGAVVPEGYAAYARVFHPARRGGEPVTWRAIAGANGRTVHREMQFGNIAGSWRESPRPELWTSVPAVGTLPRELAGALGEILRRWTTTPGRCWFAVWEGWGGLAPGTPRLELHRGARRYYLAAGSVDDATSTVHGEERAYRSASMWWPDDRSWLVATEVDLDSTYVGATAAAIDVLLADPRVEALPARLSDGITIAGDRLNPAPPERSSQR